MIFQNYPVPAPFDKYVESVFHFKDFTPDHSIERVVPTGHAFLIFELDNIPRNTFDNDSLKPNAVFTKAWISGMHEHYLSISAHQQSEMFVIQFKPFGGLPFLHSPMNRLNNSVISAEKVLGDKVFDLREELLNEKSSSQKFSVAREWLENRFDPARVPPDEIVQAVNSLMEHPGAPYGELIKNYPKTQKNLISRFKRFCGLTPKVLHRIIRFNEILVQLRSDEKLSWPQIAYQCGFSDQSHFIKEFKAFSGFNPREFIKQDYHKDEPNFFPLDRKG